MAARRRYDIPTQQTTVPTVGSVQYPMQPGQIMHGNQQGVPQAGDPSQVGYLTQTQQTPGMAPVVQPAGVPPPAVPAGWGQYTPEGADAAKMASGHDSPKYQILRTLSNYDPTAGLTGDIMAQLNALGLGNFEQLSGDKLRVTGNVDPRFLGFTELDLARNFTNDGTGSVGWQYMARNPNEPEPQQQMGLDPMQMATAFQGGGGSGAPAGGPPAPGWVQTASGAWVPPDHPLASGPLMQGGGQGGGTSSSKPFMGDEIRSKIMDLLDTGGAFNQMVLDQRSEGLREDLERTRNAETQTLDALLADRGLTGSGGDIYARQNQGERLNAQHATQLRNLHSDESQRASDRMMQALTTGAGMTIEEANNAVDWFNAQTGRSAADASAANDAARNRITETLGLGNLGLGNATLAANYNLGQGRLGLDSALGYGGLQNDWLRIMQNILGDQSRQTPVY